MNESESNVIANERPVAEEKVKKSKTKRGWLFYLKVFSVFFLFMLVAVGIAIFYFLHRLTSDSNFEKLVNQKVSEAISMEVKFEKIGISFPSIELSNIHIATDTAEMKLDSRIASVRIRPDFMAAMKGNLVIDYLNIASSATFLEMKSIKSSREAKVPEKEKKEDFDLSKISFPFKSVDLTGISFKYLDGFSKTTYDLVLKRGALSHSLISAAMPYEMEIDWIGKASANIKGDLYWPSKITSEILLSVLNINEVKKYVPTKYHGYLKDIVGTTAKASVKYDFEKNSVQIEKYDLDIQPVINVAGRVDLANMTPLKLSASATITPIEISLVKNLIPAEYSISNLDGSLEARLGAVLDADKPIELSAFFTPKNLGVRAGFIKDKILLKDGEVRYDGSGKILASGFDIGLGASEVKLKSLSLSLENLLLEGDFEAKFVSDSLVNSIEPFLGDGLKGLEANGNISLNGNIKGKLTDISSLRINAAINSKKINFSEKTFSAKGSLENINMNLKDLGKEQGVITIEGVDIVSTFANTRLKGSIKNSKDVAFDCVAAGNVNIGEFSKQFFPLFGLSAKDGQYKGNLVADLKLGGTLKDLKPSGNILASNLYADLSEYGAVIENFNGNILIDKDSILLKNIKSKFLGGNLDLNGQLKDFKNMKIEVVADIKSGELPLIQKLISFWVPDGTEGLELGGKGDLNLSLNGLVAAPAVKGSAQLSDASFMHPAVFRPIKNINGRILFDNNGLNSESLIAYWGASKVNVSGSLKDWAKLITDFKFDVAPLNLTDAAGFFLEGSGYEVLGMGVGSGTVKGAIENIKVDCLANVDLGSVTAVITEGGEKMLFPYQKLTAKVIYYENILDISSASLKLFDGDISAQGKVYIASEPIRYDFKANMNQVQTQGFLKVNADKKYENTLVGGLNGKADITGDVTGLASINGKANLAMPQGAYDSPYIIKKIAEKIKDPTLASGTIENLSGDYTISNGKISSNNTMGNSKDSTVIYRGFIGLDSSLDGSFDFELGKETCSKSSYLRELLGDNEFVKIPCKVEGTLASPRIDLPIDDLLKQKAKREVDKVLEKNNLSADKIKQEASKAVSKIGRSLKKIFK